MFVITEWIERYEVSKKGAPATVGDELRSGPLAYIRSAVHGRQMSLGFRKLQKYSGKSNLYRNFGIFQKFLEIAGDIKTPLRNGTLYNEQDKPATIEDLCFMLDLPKQTLISALQALIKAGWVNESGNSQNLPKIPGNSGTLQEHNITQHKSNQLNSTQKHSNDFSNCKNHDMAKARASLSMDLLRFAEDLDKSLKPNSKSQRKALLNLIQWLKFQIEEKLLNENIYQKILAIAKDSKSGRIPMAVFFSRIDKEIGYRAKVAKQKGGN